MPVCARCRRRLLPGERYRPWRPPEGRAPRAVCSLCEREVRLAGWMREAERPLAARDDWLPPAVRLVA